MVKHVLGPENELAALFARDLTRLSQEMSTFSDDQTLWTTLPGIANSCGNLVLHLEGNLREYVGSVLGGISYTRDRDAEFNTRGLSRKDLLARIHALQQTIPPVIAKLSEADLATNFPEDVFDKPWSTGQFLIHLYGHLNYHLGQIGYLRRVLTQSGAARFVQL